MLLWLLSIGCSRGVAWWASAVALCLGMTAALKVCSYECPLLMPDLHSPSGHTSLSTLVYGAMALVTAGEITGVWRIVAVTSGARFSLGIAASRVLLHIHSKREAGIGLVIGTVAIMAFSLRYLRCRGKNAIVVFIYYCWGIGATSAWSTTRRQKIPP